MDHSTMDHSGHDMSGMNSTSTTPLAHDMSGMNMSGGGHMMMGAMGTFHVGYNRRWYLVN